MLVTHIYRSIIFICILFLLILQSSMPTSLEVACYFTILIVNIVRERFLINRKWLYIIEWAFIFVISFYFTSFVPAFALCILTLIKQDKKWFQIFLFTFLPAIVLLNKKEWLIYLFFLCICCYIAYLIDRLEEKEKLFRRITDNERQHIYELEKTKQQLIHSSKKLVQLTELKERNRIASQLHDSIGHAIAGIYMQLQAAQKIKSKDINQSDKLLDKSIKELSETLMLVRQTVHNLVPQNKLGFHTLKQIIDSYSFCEIDFQYSDSFSQITDVYWEILISNVKEALTNTFKHSKATHVMIQLTTNRHFVRLYIKDNGIGSLLIEDNLGLRGMRTRINEVGGTLSIHGVGGFTIVCHLPLNEEGEIRDAEYFDSR